MAKVVNSRFRFVSGIVMAAALLSLPAAAQQSTSGSATTSWGGYSWQVDQGTSTTTLVAGATFNTPPGLVQLPITIHAGTTVHEVHGNITLTVPQSGINGSIIAQLRDQNGNAIAAVKMQQFGAATATVPISGTFPSGLSVTSLQLQFFVDLSGIQVINMSLVMN